MGKKAKTGKARRDKFYQLAKETGYRARSAFKLIQLNRKFSFLQNARVCIDLCAAPGGWCQVAAKFMPVSSLIVGVDLVPIKPITGVTTFTDDITSDSCRATLKKELQTWKADVVLNDGAPNVGTAWTHDAFGQAQLALQAFKISAEFLREGGTFVTKIFRSKDYHPLLWVFQQFFKKVMATKPQASRNESAEIFVVCQHYLAPDKIDPKFFSYKSVFADVSKEVDAQKLNLINPAKITKKRDGYADDQCNKASMHKEVTARAFFDSNDHLDILSTAYTIVIKDEAIIAHTNAEVLESIKDIKVLGKREIKNILKWRESWLKKEAPVTEEAEMIEEPEEEDEETKIEHQIMELQAAANTEKKQKKKRQSKLKEKNLVKIAKGLELPKGSHGADEEPNLFNLKAIESSEGLQKVDESNIDAEQVTEDLEAMEEEEEEEEEGSDEDEESGSEADDESGASEAEGEEELSSESEEDEAMRNPLIVKEKKKKIDKTNLWFNKLNMKSIDLDQEEGLEVDAMAAQYGVKSGEEKKQAEAAKEAAEVAAAAAGLEVAVTEDTTVTEDVIEEGTPKKVKFDLPEEKEEEGKEEEMKNPDLESSSESESESDDEDYRGMRDKKRKLDDKDKNTDLEVVPVKKQKQLSAAELALGQQIVTSRKRRNELMDEAYHRWAFGDEDLPDWFQDDEKKHYQKSLPVTKEQVDEYKQQVKEINARPIKKIAEAKARARFKAMKKLKKISAQADAITDNAEGQQPEQIHKLKQMMKKSAAAQKKPETTYVVAKKRNGQHQKRPAGATGKVKFVDPRMRCDVDGMKRAERKKKGKGHSSKKSKPKANRVGHKPRSR